MHTVAPDADVHTQLEARILTLPVEITTEIFLWCLTNALIPSRNKLRKTPLDKPPILLTRICRDWREIALSTPHLWNHVCLEFGGARGLRGYIDAWWVSFLDIWILRAQGQPLSMTISNLTSDTDPNAALVPLLDRHRPRWRDVTLKLPFDLFYHFEGHECLPMLRRLSLETHGISRDLDIPSPITAFERAPALDHLCLGGGLRPSHFLLPWTQLVGLELATAGAQDCLDCLRSAPNLVSCSFEIRESSSTAALLSVPPLLRLKTLTLSGPAPSIIFPYTVMPVLAELDLTGSLNAGDLSGVRFFVAHSECQLRRLRIHYISSVLTEPAIQLLGTLTSLERLDLSATEAKTIISLLHRLHDEASFLPQLQELAITHHKVRDENMHTMFRSIADALARREVSSAEHVRLCSFALFMQDEETAPRMRLRQMWQGLSQRGMRVSVRNRYERWI
ncbi:hypothetical protein DFH07DRAFT_281600 [Mycena maculata]|uniref:F-box domain-containing protein n=1 Tax=Mycena maculata TaxID=230809 RepID=A0AAD7JT31_9AGAR|nr:hypothetical protein DFH07DRAFT_281600 [Mycena maculata]